MMPHACHSLSPCLIFKCHKLTQIQLLCMYISLASCLSVHRESEMDAAAGRDGSFSSTDTTMVESPQVVFQTGVCSSVAYNFFAH